MLPKNLDESQLNAVFTPFGPITEIHIIRDQHGGSRGCAFIKYGDRAAAARAIEAVDQKVSLIVSLCYTVAKNNAATFSGS